MGRALDLNYKRWLEKGDLLLRRVLTIFKETTVLPY